MWGIAVLCGNLKLETSSGMHAPQVGATLPAAGIAMRYPNSAGSQCWVHHRAACWTCMRICAACEQAIGNAKLLAAAITTEVIDAPCCHRALHRLGTVRADVCVQSWRCCVGPYSTLLGRWMDGIHFWPVATSFVVFSSHKPVVLQSFGTSKVICRLFSCEPLFPGWITGVFAAATVFWSWVNARAEDGWELDGFVPFSVGRVRVNRCCAIASQVSLTMRMWRILLRRGSTRAAPNAAARLRMAAWTVATWHALQVCVPCWPEGCFWRQTENCCFDLRSLHAAHVQCPRVFAWHRKQILRLYSPTNCWQGGKEVWWVGCVCVCMWGSCYFLSLYQIFFIKYIYSIKISIK